MRRMRFSFKEFITVISVIFILLPCALSAVEKYPTRPIEIVTPFAPGGLSDIEGRLFSRFLEKELGVPVIHTNKPGGATVIGVSYVANAKPDGYTILNMADIIVPILMGTATYKLEDLYPIAQKSIVGSTICVSKDAPWKSFQEFVEYARSHPGVKWGNNGWGSIITLRAQSLNKFAKLNLVGVPFDGEAGALMALLGNHVQVATLSATTAKTQSEAGKVRVLFSFDAPAGFGLDAGIPDFVSVFGKEAKDMYDITIPTYIWVPSKTPVEVIRILERATENICKSPEFVTEERKLCINAAFEPGKKVLEEMPRRVSIIRTLMREVGAIK